MHHHLAVLTKEAMHYEALIPALLPDQCEVAMHYFRAKGREYKGSNPVTC